MALPDAAEAVLRRNRGIQAAKDIRECKEAQLDLSKRGLGDEGAKELAEELKVSELVHWELFVVVRCFVVLRNFLDVPVTSPKASFCLVPRMFRVSLVTASVTRIFWCCSDQ